MSKLLFLVPICFFSSSCMVAQGCNPVKTYAFARPFIPGNAIAEDQPGGKPEDRTFIYEVYIEMTCSKLPKIPVAWINGASYTTIVSAVTHNKMAAGIYDGRDDTAFVNASGKNLLYKVVFQQEAVTHIQPLAYRKVDPKTVLLQLQVNGKVKMMQTAPAKMLQPQEVY